MTFWIALALYGFGAVVTCLFLSDQPRRVDYPMRCFFAVLLWPVLARMCCFAGIYYAIRGERE